jgi:hypothetical protein
MKDPSARLSVVNSINQATIETCLFEKQGLTNIAYQCHEFI